MIYLYSVICFIIIYAFFHGIKEDLNPHVDNNNLVNSNATICYVGFGALLILHVFVNPDFIDLKGYVEAYRTSELCEWGYLLNHNIPGLKAEVGYRILCKIFSTISTSTYVILFITSFVIIYGYFYTTKRYSNMAWLSLLIFITEPYMQSLFVLRQHMAISIVLLSYPFIIEKKFASFLILVLLASSIHQTAIIFLPVYFLYRIQNKNKLVLTLIAIFFVFSLSMTFILNWTADNYVSDTAQYDQVYLEKRADGMNAKVAYLMSAILAFRIYVLKNNFFKPGITKLLSIILCFAFIYSVVGIGFVGFSRLNMYFTCATFLIIPQTLSYIGNSNYRAIIGLIYWLFTLIFFVKNSDYYISQDIWFFVE